MIATLRNGVAPPAAKASPDAARVRAGAALFDREAPGWAEDFSGVWLDMQDGTNCALAQVFGGYTRGLDRLFGHTGPRLDRAVAHGFTLSPDEPQTPARWSALRRLWVAEARRRQGEATS